MNKCCLCQARCLFHSIICDDLITSFRNGFQSFAIIVFLRKFSNKQICCIFRFVPTFSSLLNCYVCLSLHQLMSVCSTLISRPPRVPNHYLCFSNRRSPKKNDLSSNYTDNVHCEKNVKLQYDCLPLQIIE